RSEGRLPHPRAPANAIDTAATSSMEVNAAEGTHGSAGTHLQEATSSSEVSAGGEAHGSAGADADETTSRLEVSADGGTHGSSGTDMDEITSSLEAFGSRRGESASRYIPVGLRRQVFERDQGCCTFVGVDGRRCRSTYQLQFHHKVPFARGGATTYENLTLYCGRHNRHQAYEDYGAAHMDRFIAQDVDTSTGASRVNRGHGRDGGSGCGVCANVDDAAARRVRISEDPSPSTGGGTRRDSRIAIRCVRGGDLTGGPHASPA
ncbi:MAG TPA: HNH endonuclease signature motif containing protein, partial [Myxococcaceae bacterium]|nr:HNH endonuclease signature motif containing protein [Myxococcaceae bacterium]